jgi:hypothetical protein
MQVKLDSPHLLDYIVILIYLAYLLIDFHLLRLSRIFHALRQNRMRVLAFNPESILVDVEDMHLFASGTVGLVLELARIQVAYGILHLERMADFLFLGATKEDAAALIRIYVDLLDGNRLTYRKVLPSQ